MFKNQFFLRKCTFSLSICIVSVFMLYGQVEGGSVYAIPQHWGSAKLNAYEILKNQDEGKLKYKSTYELSFDGAADGHPLLGIFCRRT